MRKCNGLIKSKYWRIVIPNLIQFKDSTLQQLLQLKKLVLDRLANRSCGIYKKSEFYRGLRYYHIAVQRHANGVPHLDILLIYYKSIQRRRTDFDYLLKHGNITTYRKLNAAILEYGKKQDVQALSNIPQDHTDVLRLFQLKQDPYRYLQLQMLKDPLHFNLEQYCRQHDFYKHISGWSSLKTKLKDSQTAAANLYLKTKPGFKFISRGLIQSQLTPSQLKTFDSWKGYQTIVDRLNQIHTHGCNRPFKSKQLLLIGPPNTGKTSLVRQVQNHCAVYHMDVTTWFPNYRDGVYKLIFWDQFKLKGGMSHTDLLKFLQGSPMDLQYKGGSSLRMDNQLIVMTSNMTLQQHIKFKFKDQQQRTLARDNLAARIEVVLIPPSHNLFFLFKLFKISGS